jgi:hypothetical protein
MSLSRKIAAALDENTKVHDPPCVVVVEDGPHRLTLHLSALDSVGLGFQALEFHTTVLSPATSDSLRSWGERLAGRITYLLEPLSVLEVDSAGEEVQVRSQTPTTRAERRGYYEIRLFKLGMLRMERFAFDEQTRQRRSIPCQLTREVLERLADDLAASTA